MWTAAYSSGVDATRTSHVAMQTLPIDITWQNHGTQQIQKKTRLEWAGFVASLAFSSLWAKIILRVEF